MSDLARIPFAKPDALPPMTAAVASMAPPPDSGAWAHRVYEPAPYLRSRLTQPMQFFRAVFRQPFQRREITRAEVVVVLGYGDFLNVKALDAGGGFNRYQSFVVGAGHPPLLTEHRGSRTCFDLVMPPWAAYELFDGALQELGDAVAGLDVLWGGEARLLSDRLSEQRSWRKGFELVETFITRRMQNAAREPRQEIRWAWEQLETQAGDMPVGDLARHLGWSHRHFVSCFRQQTGVTPKAAARAIRFASSHRLLRADPAIDLATLAAHCGYSDQSHFTREFQRFAGSTPAACRPAPGIHHARRPSMS